MKEKIEKKCKRKSLLQNLHMIIYQKYQFGPVRNGSLSKALSNYDAGKFTSSYHKDCIKAAKVALARPANGN